MPATAKIDGNSFLVTEITGLMGTKLPTVTDSGGVRRATVGDKLRFFTEPPGFIGFPESEDPHALDDAFNVLTMWGAFMRGPQKQSPTISALPTTFKTDGDGFYDAAGLGRLFLFGNGASSNDECVFYYDSGTDTWISAQVNSDLTGDVTAISGAVEIGGVFYLLGRQLVDGEAANAKILYKMVTLGVVTNFVNNGVAETLPSGYDRTRFLLEGGEDPSPQIIAAARRLVDAGCEMLVMPCNTASAFSGEVTKAVSVKLFDWINAGARRL
ncbi:MAG: aspartate/glutamate racemase family protein, partial [Chloroflexi bacterium]|nr:aspartate/glutamate racemase family protein [Chloroflexota bacterium]